VQSNTSKQRRSQWLRGVRRRSAGTRVLELRVRIPPGAWDVCLLCVLCVIRQSSLQRADADHWYRGGPTEYGVSECDRGTSTIKSSPTTGCQAIKKNSRHLTFNIRCNLRYVIWIWCKRQNFEIRIYVNSACGRNVRSLRACAIQVSQLSRKFREQLIKIPV